MVVSIHRVQQISSLLRCALSCVTQTPRCCVWQMYVLMNLVEHIILNVCVMLGSSLGVNYLRLANQVSSQTCHVIAADV